MEQPRSGIPALLTVLAWCFIAIGGVAAMLLIGSEPVTALCTAAGAVLTFALLRAAAVTITTLQDIRADVERLREAAVVREAETRRVA